MIPEAPAVFKHAFEEDGILLLLSFALIGAAVAIGLALKMFEGVADDPYAKLRAKRAAEKKEIRSRRGY